MAIQSSEKVKEDHLSLVYGERHFSDTSKNGTIFSSN